MNRTALIEVVPAILITQFDALRRLLGTTEPTTAQWALAFVPAIGLFLLWELGKAIARRSAKSPQTVRPSAEGAKSPAVCGGC